jgi:uncharacterized protein (DUF952 family)
MEQPSHIYHIVLPEDWEIQSLHENYTHKSLESEGFIHCSQWNQLQATWNRFFGGREDILILKINPLKLNVSLKFEEASDNAGTFPHIFGQIPKYAIEDILKITDISK